jgi:hypothetical protein
MKRSTYHFFMNDIRKIPVVDPVEIYITDSISKETKDQFVTRAGCVLRIPRVLNLFLMMSVEVHLISAAIKFGGKNVQNM